MSARRGCCILSSRCAITSAPLCRRFRPFIPRILVAEGELLHELPNLILQGADPHAHREHPHQQDEDHEEEEEVCRGVDAKQTCQGIRHDREQGEDDKHHREEMFSQIREDFKEEYAAAHTDLSEDELEEKNQMLVAKRIVTSWSITE